MMNRFKKNRNKIVNFLKWALEVYTNKNNLLALLFIYALGFLVLFSGYIYANFSEYTESVSKTLEVIILEKTIDFLPAIVIAIMSIMPIFWLHNRNQKKEYQDWLLRNKNGLLIEIIDIFISCNNFSAPGKRDPFRPFLSYIKYREFQERIENMRLAIMVHGSSETLKAWEEIENTICEKMENTICEKMENAMWGKMENAMWGKIEGAIPYDEAKLIRHEELFLRTLRKDLGHDDSDLPPGAVWATILKPEDRQLALDVCKGEKYD